MAAANHPTDKVLSDYGLGKLAGAANDTVEAHITACDDCRGRVAELSSDGFLDRLKRAARPEAKSGFAASQPPVEKSTVYSADDADIPPVLLTLEAYVDIRRLGHGGMGDIFLARNVRMDREEVLKVMNKSLMEKAGAAARFEREIRSVGKLNHPNIVTTYAAQQVGDTVVLSMENAGEDLAKFVEKRGPLSVARACYFLHQAALGLQYAHEKGLVHRDIKPSNLMVLQNGTKWQVKILDFGLAKQRNEPDDPVDQEHRTKPGQALGTPSYMAPEQIRDAKSVDIRADIYALGCTIYFLLTGRPPFVEDNIMSLIFAHGEKVPQSTNELRADVPAALAELIATMLAKDPKDRPQTPAEVAKALVPFIRPGAKVPATASSAQLGLAETDLPDATKSYGPSNVSQPRAHQSKAWPFVAIGLVALAVAGLVVGSLILKTDRGSIVLEDVPDDAEVTVNGAVVTVARDGDKATISIDRDGTYAVVVRDGTEVMAKDVTVKVGGEPVRVRYEPPEPVAPPIPPAPPSPDKSNFVSLFNGHQLVGFRSPPVFKGTWKIENETLVVSGIRNPRAHPAPGNLGVLESTRSYENFVLRIVVAPLESSSRSHPIFVRLTASRKPMSGIKVSTGRFTKKGIWISPGLIQVGATGIADDDDVDDDEAVPSPPGFRAVDPIRGKPYTIEIAAIGNRVTTSVDGVKVHEAVDPTPSRGPIRLLAKKATQAKYKRIEIQELDATGNVPKGVAVTNLIPSKEERQARIRGVGLWSIKDRVLTGRASSSSLIFGDPKWTNYEMDVEYRIINGPPEISVGVRVEFSAGLQCAMLKLGTESSTLDLWAGGGPKPLESKRKPIRHSDWNKVRFRVEENRIQCFAGPADQPQTVPIFSRTVRMPQSGRVELGIGYPRQPKAATVEFQNITVKAFDGKLLWEGLPELPAP